jgi:hypothetical protein
VVWKLGTESRAASGAGDVPSGTAHAVDPDQGRTACGRPIRSLHVWPDIPWRRVGMLGLTRCVGCLAEAEEGKA